MLNQLTYSVCIIGNKLNENVGQRGGMSGILWKKGPGIKVAKLFSLFKYRFSKVFHYRHLAS